MNVGAAELLPGAAGGRDFPAAGHRHRGALPAAAVLAALPPGPGGAGVAGVHRAAGRSGARGAADRGAAGPARAFGAEPQSDRPVRQPARPQPGASVRGRPARPGRGLPGDLWDAGLAGGGHLRHGDGDADRRVRRDARRLLPRLGGHAALAVDRCRAVDPDPAARPRHRRCLCGAGLRGGRDPARAWV